jgi:hypothetical protein
MLIGRLKDNTDCFVSVKYKFKYTINNKTRYVTLIIGKRYDGKPYIRLCRYNANFKTYAKTILPDKEFFYGRIQLDINELEKLLAYKRKPFIECLKSAKYII